ncbi:GNAT family N-acetyltransferase [Telmatospirillum siberiense]|uniref:GNAT family N-acetyltransferase n=1 Tax=Telmatospirillum siberiense TaxID=382514 RepID=A0A2N3PSQ4_9PROT|nr:GNAT family N-acetyltransferase [Telmatospirillum siberiense]PKU23435.1 GNAT family N-acetyltransferase [Telmatospirillum siberiense]
MTLTATRDAFAPGTHLLTDDLVLRPLAEGEAERLGALCAAFDPYHRLGQTADALSGYLRRPDPALFRFAIERHSSLAGIVAVRTPWLRGPFLEMLALLPAGRGHGLGRQTVDWVAAEASLISANLWTTVSDFNESARAFYRRLNFQPVSELPGLITEGSTEILLRRRLKDR